MGSHRRARRAEASEDSRRRRDLRSSCLCSAASGLQVAVAEAKDACKGVRKQSLFQKPPLHQVGMFMPLTRTTSGEHHAVRQAWEKKPQVGKTVPAVVTVKQDKNNRRVIRDCPPVEVAELYSIGPRLRLERSLRVGWM